MKHAGEFDAIEKTFNRINDTLEKAKAGDNGALIWCVQALSHEMRALAKKVVEISQPDSSPNFAAAPPPTFERNKPKL